MRVCYNNSEVSYVLACVTSASNSRQRAIMEPKELPPIEWLREHLEYNPETGKVYLKKKWGPLPTKVGAEIGNNQPNESGYMCVKLKGKTYPIHRIAYALYHEADPYPFVIDHKNKIKTDNSITNLRKATKRQNMFNRSKQKSKSGHTGITYRTHRKKAWMVSCNRTYIGSYETLDEALTARAEAERKLQLWAN